MGFFLPGNLFAVIAFELPCVLNTQVSNQRAHTGNVDIECERCDLGPTAERLVNFSPLRASWVTSFWERRQQDLFGHLLLNVQRLVHRTE